MDEISVDYTNEQSASQHGTIEANSVELKSNQWKVNSVHKTGGTASQQKKISGKPICESSESKVQIKEHSKKENGNSRLKEKFNRSEKLKKQLTGKNGTNQKRVRVKNGKTIQPKNDSMTNNNIAKINAQVNVGSSFSLETIQVAAENGEISCPIHSGARKILCDNLNYRVTNVIHCAAQFMHHAKRTRLTTRDFSETLQELDCEPILGYNNVQNQPEFFTLQCNSHRLSLPRDYYIEVDLKHHSASILLERFDSNALFNLQSKLSKVFRVEFAMQSHHCDTIDTFSYSKYFVQITDILLSLNSSEFLSISANEQHRILQVIRYDLANNPKIKPTLGAIVKFVCSAIQAWVKSSVLLENETMRTVEFTLACFNQTQIYLGILRAAIMNPLFYELSLETTLVKSLSETLLSICFDTNCSEKLLYNNFATLYWPLLELCSSAALLLSQILNKYSFGFTNFQQLILKSLHERIVSKRDVECFMSETLLRHTLVDLITLRIHRFIGFDACLRYLNPLIMNSKSYFSDYLVNQNREKSNNLTKINPIIQAEMCLVGELILKSLATVTNSDECIMLSQCGDIYSYYYDHFGDSLAMRLPTNRSIHHQTQVHPPSRKRFFEKKLSHTSTMIKPQSPFVFNKTRFEASQQKYKKAPPKTYLYQEEYERDLNNGVALSTFEIVFEGIRVKARNDDDQENWRGKKGPLEPYHQSEYYRLSIDYHTSHKCMLGCYPHRLNTSFSLFTNL